MKLHYMGKYNREPESLPHGEHIWGAVAFKEPKDPKALGRVGSVISFTLIIPLLVILALRCEGHIGYYYLLTACVLGLILIVPHEILHAICFKKDVYLYTDLKHGIVFVTGTEVMSKGRYIFMSLLPNAVLGLIPYVIALIIPNLALLGLVGAFLISMGSCDYINAFNALAQMPKGSKTYLYGFNFYWFVP